MTYSPSSSFMAQLLRKVCWYRKGLGSILIEAGKLSSQASFYGYLLHSRSHFVTPRVRLSVCLYVRMSELVHAALYIT